MHQINLTIQNISHASHNSETANFGTTKKIHGSAVDSSWQRWPSLWKFGVISIQYHRYASSFLYAFFPATSAYFVLGARLDLILYMHPEIYHKDTVALNCMINKQFQERIYNSIVINEMEKEECY
jgi:hypothetical protein